MVENKSVLQLKRERVLALSAKVEVILEIERLLNAQMIEAFREWAKLVEHIRSLEKEEAK